MAVKQALPADELKKLWRQADSNYYFGQLCFEAGMKAQQRLDNKALDAVCNVLEKFSEQQATI